MKTSKNAKNLAAPTKQDSLGAWLRHADVDFGTYHHSTPERSADIRERAEKAFLNLLRPLYLASDPLRILDAGCGLGFLTYVAANCFPKAHITGIDLFEHDSISAISMEKAANNMRSMGIDSRVSFLKHDLTTPMDLDTQYDLAVSNLVFHNMETKRFEGYETILSALKPKGFFVIGDLFSHGEGDMDYFRERATLISELDEGPSGPWVYKIRVLRKQ